MVKKHPLRELLDSIKYFIESKRGLYSLDTYLDVVGEYCDKQIITAEKDEQLRYMGGQCVVNLNKERSSIVMIVTLYFEDKDKKNVVKEASRELSLSRFTSETPEQIGLGLKFDIDKPEV